MPSLNEIFRALYGAYRLARFDPNGMQYFDATAGGFWKSFFAAVVIAPFYVLVLLQQFQIGEGGFLAHFLAIHLLAYFIVWVMFALVMITVARALDRDNRYVGFIVAYNWTSVLQHALYLPGVFLFQSGAIAPDAGVFMLMVLLTVITVYFWFVARTALDIPGVAAAGVVFLEFVLGIVFQGFASSVA